MNTNNPSTTQLDEVYFSVAEEFDLSVVSFSFHHPSVERMNLPIAQGGYASRVFEDDFRWGQVASLEFSSGHVEEQQMGRELEIHPLFLANPFTIVEGENGERLYMRKAMYISANDVPSGWRLRSARSLVFVIADDPELRLCAVTFKSFNSDRIRRLYTEYQRQAASLTKSVYGKPIHSAFLRATLGVGGSEKVSPRDSGARNAAVLIAYPALTITRRDGKPVLAEKDKAHKIAEYLRMDQLKFYPFCMSETMTREIQELPWLSGNMINANAALPAPKRDAEVRALTPADFF